MIRTCGCSSACDCDLYYLSITVVEGEPSAFSDDPYEPEPEDLGLPEVPEVLTIPQGRWPAKTPPRPTARPASRSASGLIEVSR